MVYGFMDVYGRASATTIAVHAHESCVFVKLAFRRQVRRPGSREHSNPMLAWICWMNTSEHQ